ncbi:uncharacterized protein LACBIDRAFT_252516 [Laccaria bicolor S238N-H82]|uniref:Predicted protein n=1 Tax=Laccaria bicolor (strain S238N-H82 / ATCC MYA-4686) TaxID=486041 RepID=B0DLG9_LACBS|nr:uncharacterized protein LACBIDRAFT_252516 [Laccaria bicolor S238N-H82]EDR04565.1 predicted protein [Laccaria bicolor S238N-H82]|eukprot:XP_001884737.1 predicted protein [Laccaria bicolor S238N-H82]
MLDRDDYVFFWKTNEKYGWASQWYSSPFTVKLKLEEEGEEEEVTFASAEHWMMVQKALLFGDYGKAREILGVEGVSSSDMAHVKALGRQVSGFDEAKWVDARQDIVLQGNMHKFSQNGELLEKLMLTGDKKMVEASPRDRIWGIGFGEKNALNQRERWGLNLLGIALEGTRRKLNKGSVGKEGHEA